MSTMQGKTVIITGASSGIGEELAVSLAARGANLVLAARSEEALARVTARCEKAGGRALGVPTDVAEPEACRRMVERAVEAFGGIDMLVNNAGISMRSRFEDIRDVSLFDRLMRVNYLGAVYCTHAALPHIKARKGLLVAISSVQGKLAVPERTGYVASKHALQGFFDSLRVELLDTGVDVLVVSPGYVSTDIGVRALGSDGQPRATRDSVSDAMDAHTCAERILRAIDQRDREVLMTAKARIGVYLKLLVPGLVDRMALKAMRKRGGA
ncbi:SDR family oxidoreductase [Hyalangium gracile]|uniref:SDR family oxidoreductase n=1 Tax=Hyalangium gracile TaxID=394092 RepID=UPI001CCEA675|nr:SDR family oxidoreductase [Hyalangium gracile]